jgi:hypothetical protein
MWEAEKIHYGQLVEMEDPATGKVQMYQTTQEIIGYQGNRVYNISPYDFFPDPRVPVGRFQEGEYCGVRKRLGWNAILAREDQGYYNSNVKRLKDHATAGPETDGSQQLRRPDFASPLFEDSVEGKEVTHPAGAVVIEVYVRLVPDEWGVGTTKYPQIWCFTITDDLGLIIGASPLGLIHGRFPIDVAEMELEAYSVLNRGLPEIIEPIQNTVDWLLNTHFYNVRAAVNNQFILDPSKIVAKDAKSSGPGFVWRLRPEAYGSDLTKIFTQIPVQDVTRQHMNDLSAMFTLGERTLGVNEQIMGGLSGGSSRKTATEVRTSTTFGVNRLKTIAEYISSTAFSSHSQKLVQSTQQFYTGQEMFRIAGSLMLEAKNMIQVTPEDIAGFYSFVPVDGTLPVDRMAQANLWKEILGSLRMMPPNVAMSYDFSRIFAWVASLAGLKNINQFRIQVVPDAQLQAQAQAGNVVPMPSPAGSPVAPGNSASTASGLNALEGRGSLDANF